MGSNPAASLTSKMKRSDKAHNMYVASSSSAEERASQESHEPMYRKRVSKPGQKEKRLPNKKNVNPGRNSKGSKDSSKTDGTKSTRAPKGKANGGSSKKKTKRETNEKKKKKSTLAFWFCMSANTDAPERKSQAPIAKPPKPISAPDYDIPGPKANNPDRQKADNPDDIVSEEMPTEILATKHSRRNASKKRYSAPASSEWTTIVTKAIVENPSQPPRSRTPTNGVRYRYDGTLERPYVYPGGLTFQSGDKGRRNDETYYYANDSFCDSQLSDRSHIDSCDQYDENGVRTKFYLTYDYDLENSSHPKDRRYSLPPGFVNGEGAVTTGQTMHSQKSNDCSVVKNDNQDVIYDIPYESENEVEKKTAVQTADTNEKRNSYYSAPLQNASCIYMWHSCEDLKHCKDKYHSKDGLNRICGVTLDETESNRSYPGDEENPNNRNGEQTPMSSISARSSNRSSRSSGHTRNRSLPVELSHDRVAVKCADVVRRREENTVMNQNIVSGDKLETREGGRVTSCVDTPSESGHPRNVRKAFSLSFEQPEEHADDNPFKRNMVRSSCMPGNKRFFLPPPPCYTPPKEDMEAGLPFMSKANRTCGSQTDLTEDVRLIDIDMEQRDFSLKRDQSLSQDARKSHQADHHFHVRPVTSVETESKYTITCSHENAHIPSNNSMHDSKVQETHNSNLDTRTDSSVDHDNKHTQSANTSTPKINRRLFNANDELTLYNSFPKPVPRKRIRNKDSTSSSFSTPETETVQTVKIDSGVTLIAPKPNVSATPSKKIPPVPKKRRSQMIESDLVYTAADIDMALASCNEDTLSPLPLDAEKEARHAHIPAADQTHNSDHRDGAVGRTNKNLNTTDSRDTNNVGQSFSTLEHGHRLKVSPEAAHQISTSPASSCNSQSPGPKKATAPCPSVDTIADVFQRMSYDSDNEDNCNADDEMSVHNEDFSASVQNLLRSRSIFDRSLAVTRKRRQRLRGRKCQSQLLSSADLDQYDEMSKTHLWKNVKSDTPQAHSTRLDWYNEVTLQRERGFPNSPILRKTHLFKHSYTDSGNDSDMLSPTDSRHHQFVKVFDEWDKKGPYVFSKGTVDKKTWEHRLREKHQLRKARSIEQLLLLTQEVKVVQKPSLETCV